MGFLIVVDDANGSFIKLPTPQLLLSITTSDSFFQTVEEEGDKAPFISDPSENANGSPLL